MYERIKGFRDVYPREMAAQRAVIDTVEAVVRRYGFREIATPALESTAMYVDKSGPEIVEELYAFEDKGGREVALTPELTPTVARMLVARQQALTLPVKWFSTRPFWRYEQVQQGRFREFYQTNVDVFGTAEPTADAEVLALAADMLRELGVDPADFDLLVSHRDVLGGVLAAFDTEVDVRAAVRAVDKREKIDEETYFRLLADAGLDADRARTFDDLLDTDDLTELVAFAGTDRVADAIANLEAVLDAAADLGAREYCTVALDTARGFDYYTGMVFECFEASGAVSRSIFGGGRYDELIAGLGGQATPAVGFAPGVMHSTLPLLLQETGAWPAEELATDYYVLRAGETHETAARIARELRAAGNVVETDLTDRGFGSQLDYADTINARTVVIVGERDLADGEVTVKDMASGDQTTVPVGSFPGEHDTPTYDDFA